MPATAAERNLLDPLNPIEALPKAAEFLKDLRSQFGNLGLAAAAYNAGPGRVRAWMAGAASLPAETRTYVQAITGNSVDDWAARRGPEAKAESGISCETLMAKLKQPPTNFPGSASATRGDGRDPTLGCHSRRGQIAPGNLGSICRTPASVRCSVYRTGPDPCSNAGAVPFPAIKSGSALIRGLLQMMFAKRSSGRGRLCGPPQSR